jgi:hypothetical protein
MGRIRKTLAWTFSPAGTCTVVRSESSSDQAARHVIDLLTEQNCLVGQIVGERSSEKDNRAAQEFEERAKRVAASTIELGDIDNSLLRTRVRIIREGRGDL